MGGGRGGGEEEGGRKETLLCGVEAQETHCNRRQQGVQVNIDTSPMVNSVMAAHCASRSVPPRQTEPPLPTPCIEDNSTQWELSMAAIIASILLVSAGKMLFQKKLLAPSKGSFSSYKAVSLELEVVLW